MNLSHTRLVKKIINLFLTLFIEKIYLAQKINSLGFLVDNNSL